MNEGYRVSISLGYVYFRCCVLCTDKEHHFINSKLQKPGKDSRFVLVQRYLRFPYLWRKSPEL